MLSRIAAVAALAGGMLAAADVAFETRIQDWHRAGAIAFEAVNGGNEPVSFSVEVTDAAGARTTGHTALPLAPGAHAVYALTLDTPPPLEMGMRGEPLLAGHTLLAEDHHPVDAARMTALRVLGPKTLRISRITGVPGIGYDKIVDAFGQYAKEDWPGKLHSAADFASRLAEERAELKLRPSLPERDEYGGWAGGPKLEATGYFRAAKHGGKWWLVTPGGHLFFSLGLDCVTAREGGTVVTGREQMFEWLPAAGDPLSAFFAGGGMGTPVGLQIKRNAGRSFNFYGANLERKYGAPWQEGWREMTLERLRAWGFNTIANWSDPVFYEAKRMPYTVTLAVRGRLPEVPGPSDYWRHMSDVFDPQFAAAVEASVGATAGQRRDDPWCLGYFVDNELSWGNMRSLRNRYGLALGALGLGATSAAKRAFLEQLQKRYGEIGKLNAAWGTGFAAWQALLDQPYRFDGEPPAGMQPDLAAFMTAFAERYFQTIRDALRRHDPHHLYLGTRFAGHTREEVEACARYCDVISFNIYRPRLDPAQWSVLDGIDKPAIIGEFHMGALDRGMFHPGLVAARDQAERARLYADYVRSVADHPLFVGCHFFKYCDEPLTGRPGDGENYNIGFTSVTDSPYPEMVEAARAVHGEIYRRRSAR